MLGMQGEHRWIKSLQQPPNNPLAPDRRKARLSVESEKLSAAGEAERYTASGYLRQYLEARLGEVIDP